MKLASTEVVDMATASGLDFCVVDLEHSQLADHEAFRLVRHARALRFPALVRIAENDRGLVNRLLEAGADGIQLSTVRSAAQVEELRAACRYAPAGRRSISLNHPAARYGLVALADYVAAEGEGPIVVAQIETAETEDTLEAVLAARPDVVFVGVVDLTVDLGLDRDRVRARFDEIAGAAARADIPLGAYALDDERVTYDLVASDLGLLQKAVAELA